MWETFFFHRFNSSSPFLFPFGQYLTPVIFKMDMKRRLKVLKTTHVLPLQAFRKTYFFVSTYSFQFQTNITETLKSSVSIGNPQSETSQVNWRNICSSIYREQDSMIRFTLCAMLPSGFSRYSDTVLSEAAVSCSFLFCTECCWRALSLYVPYGL